jgi:hypothetical protein
MSQFTITRCRTTMGAMRRIAGTARPDRCAQSFRPDLSPAGSNVPQLSKARRRTRLNRHCIERAGETGGRPKAHPLNSAALAGMGRGVFCADE